MALTLRALYSQCRLPSTKRVEWNIQRRFPLKIISSCTRPTTTCNFRTISRLEQNYVGILPIPLRKYTTESDNTKKPPQEPLDEQYKNLSLFQRFKKMARDYWYVLLPVHGATSVLWFGGFYYLVQSGVDILGMLESMGVSEKVINPIRNSGAGYVALAFACYKIVTPFRYAVTLGGTTYAIRKLRTLGWIKPVPSKERIKEMFQEKRDKFQEKRGNFQDKFLESKHHYQSQMKEKRSQVFEEMKRYKTDMRSLKDKVKKM